MVIVIRSHRLFACPNVVPQLNDIGLILGTADVHHSMQYFV
jgi:hypothetical protein